ncbi:metal ABC transporter ATP-binding protein [Ornithinimicrobium faecis]|uniref:Metal ABC transporter ATP-binding protein n=1 Tax=Ornithinimicrobium faecis TaxID=2934158 RepID=A0ABY4YPE0_9MICO|nr:metal ABC transporter ATP-binding protein [Ornithinimicrobium sp. HY1793]USQ78482.1 metal ABC transporter ATP-binding protein [Ornithinimicrobium sp. HY1793]
MLVTALPHSAVPTPAIRLDHASFGYAGRPFTEGVNLTLQPGEVVALLGPNGSGKSTLVRGLLGLNDHVGGTVEIYGTPLEDLQDRSRLGYVPQRHTLSASVRSTVREVVATGQLASRPWWRRASADDRALVEKAADTVGLADRLEADVATLSGGQQRRVLIARALASRPDVLIMDEPTAGVDAANQDVLATVLRRLAGLGVTMLVVTHELAALRGIVDRIVEMDAGQVSFDGPPAQYAEHRASVSRAADAGLAQGHSSIRHHHGYDEHHHDDGPVEAPGLLSGVGPMDGPVEEQEL